MLPVPSHPGVFLTYGGAPHRFHARSSGLSRSSSPVVSRMTIRPNGMLERPAVTVRDR